MWISLQMLSLKVRILVIMIVLQISTILKFDAIYQIRNGPRFCIAIDLEQGWIT